MSNLRDIILGSHQILVHNHAITGCEAQDWILLGQQVYFDEPDFRVTSYTWHHANDQEKAITATITENPSGTASLANLRQTVGASTAHYASSGTVDPDEKDTDLQKFGPNAYVDQGEYEASGSDVDAIQYSIGNMSVDIKSIGEEAVIIKDFGPLAVHFFSIKELALGDYTVAEGPDAIQLELQKFKPAQPQVLRFRPLDKHYYVFIVNTDKCILKQNNKRISLTVDEDSAPNFMLNILSVDEHCNRVLHGPFNCEIEN